MLTEEYAIALTLTRGRATKGFGPRVTDEQALVFGGRREGFHVGVRYRDKQVRTVATRLAKLGMFKGKRHKRYGDGSTYRTTALGRRALTLLRI